MAWLDDNRLACNAPQAGSATAISAAARIRALPFARIAKDVYSAISSSNDLDSAVRTVDWTALLASPKEEITFFDGKKIQIFLGSIFGFNASVYRLCSSRDQCAVLAFEGSADLVPMSIGGIVPTLKDWLLTNVPTTLDVLNSAEAVIPFGIFSVFLNPRRAPSTQYDVALIVAQEAQRRFGDNLILTGHSLGGGLAQFAALVTGVRAIVFNSGGIGFKNLSAHEKALLSWRIVHICTTKDLVNDMVTKNLDFLSRHFGTRYEIGTGGHSMDDVISRLQIC